jgi:hypothetical protein
VGTKDVGETLTRSGRASGTVWFWADENAPFSMEIGLAELEKSVALFVVLAEP